MTHTPEAQKILDCLAALNARPRRDGRRIPVWIRTALVGAGLTLAACRSPGPDPAGNNDVDNVNNANNANSLDNNTNCDYSAPFDEGDWQVDPDLPSD